MGAMCSQSSDNPVNSNNRNPNDPLSLVPKASYTPDEIMRTNPYDYKDELYFVEIEKEKQRLEKNAPIHPSSSHHLNH